MRQVLDLAAGAAPLGLTALIAGETGAGKDRCDGSLTHRLSETDVCYTTDTSRLRQ